MAIPAADFQFVIDSPDISDPEHLSLRLCKSLSPAGGNLLSVFFHGSSARVLQDAGCREQWRQAVPATTGLWICSAAWQQAGGGDMEQGWEVAGWPVWFERRLPTARLVSFGARR